MARTATIALAVLTAAYCVTAEAADISGAWITNPEACGKVYVRKGNTIQFTDSADMYGSGFIIEGDRVRGKMVTCRIKTTKQDGDTVHLLLTCATDIALSDNEFSLKIVDHDKLSRIFPGLPELKTDYFRCRM